MSVKESRPKLSSEYPSDHIAGFLDVGDGHEIFIEILGPQNGVPVIEKHGGPGTGYDASHALKYDLSKTRLVLFDQRGSGASRHADRYGLANNTTSDLIADINKVADLAKFSDYYTVGGSWGSFLSLVHAVNHPDRIRGAVLWGIFTNTKEEYASQYSPEIQVFAGEFFDRLTKAVGNADLSEVGAIESELLRRILIGGRIGRAAATAYGLLQFKIAEPIDPIDQATIKKYEAINSKLLKYMPSSLAYYALSLASGQDLMKAAALPLNYYSNNCFADSPDLQIIPNLHKLAGKNLTIVQGLQDMNTQPEAAINLDRAAREQGVDAELTLIDGAGHLRTDRLLHEALKSRLASLV